MNSDSDLPTFYFDEINEFLETRTRALEENDGTQTFELNASAKRVNSSRISSTNATTSRPISCPLCKAKHFINACPQFF